MSPVKDEKKFKKIYHSQNLAAQTTPKLWSEFASFMSPYDPEGFSRRAYAVLKEAENKKPALIVIKDDSKKGPTVFASGLYASAETMRYLYDMNFITYEKEEMAPVGRREILTSFKKLNAEECQALHHFELHQVKLTRSGYHVVAHLDHMYAASSQNMAASNRPSPPETSLKTQVDPI